MGVAIARLRLRGPPDRAAWARFAIEDGIRTTWPDDERLVLIRRVALGRTPTDRRPERRTAQFRQAWEAATQGRRHGGDSTAGDANCVWFASRGEAWRLLLRELIAGRRPVAWFWRLAVPAWHGQPVRAWLATCLEEALAGRGPIEALPFVEAVVAEGGPQLLFAAAERMANAMPAAIAEADAVMQRDFVAPATAAGALEGDAPPSERSTVALVQTIRQTLPAPLVAVLEALVLQIGVTSPIARGLLERLLLRGSPSFRLAPVRLAAAVRSYARLLDAGEVPMSNAGHPAPTRPAIAAVRPFDAPMAEERQKGEAETETRTAPAPERTPSREAESRMPAAPASPASLVEEARSEFAGLWLIVPLLIRLGYREWLSDHPDLAACDGGRRLIRAIGRHFGVPPGDVAMLAFADCIPDDPDFARPWRVAADFHLWRSARIRLHEVVRRQGWLRLSEERLVIRFDPESVDLRLRRRALDIDPGWTDWLGLSVRYRYATRGEA